MLLSGIANHRHYERFIGRVQGSAVWTRLSEVVYCQGESLSLLIYVPVRWDQPMLYYKTHSKQLGLKIYAFSLLNSILFDMNYLWIQPHTTFKVSVHSSVPPSLLSTYSCYVTFLLSNCQLCHTISYLNGVSIGINFVINLVILSTEVRNWWVRITTTGQNR